MMRRSLLAWVAVVVLVLSACGPAATPTPPTPTPLSPRATQPRATSTPTPRPKPTPTTAPTTDKYGGTLHLSVTRGDEPWDIMAFPRGGTSVRVIVPITFSQLLVVPNTPETGCSLRHRLEAAEAWTWKDDKTLEVKLREGITFHNKRPVNGREMTSQDVAFSLNRLRAVQSRIYSVTRNISGIQAIDKYSVRITLDRPYPSLPEDVLGTGFGAVLLAKESGDFSKETQWGSWADPEKSHIGSGPFMFVKEVPTVKATYVRDPNYWKKGMPFVDAIEYSIMPEWSTQMAALAGGKIDGWPGQTPFEIYRAVKKTMPQANVSQGCVLWGNPTLYMNTQSPPFNDVRLRRAAAMAIDKKSLLGLIENQGMLPAVFPPSLPFILKVEDFSPEVRRYLEYRPDEARKLLAEAGYPLGLDTTIHFAPTALPRLWTLFAEAVIPALEAAGIRSKVKTYERGAWDAVANKGQYEGLAMVSSTIHEPWLYLASFYSKNEYSMNRSLVVDPQIDALVEELSLTVDQAKRESLAKQIQVRIADQAYWIYLPAQFDWAVSRPYVRDFGPMPFFPSASTWAETVWLDKSQEH